MLTAALCIPTPVTVVVVLDASDDDSAQLAGEYGPDVHFVSIEAANVGTARAVGFAHARSLCGDDADCWYATTDADSRVDPGWLVHQLDLGADMVLGVVRVADWHLRSADLADRYVQTYEADPLSSDGQHEHIHGANMGFSSRAYWRVGGFRALACGEDVDLVERFEAAGYRIHRDASFIGHHVGAHPVPRSWTDSPTTSINSMTGQSQGIALDGPAATRTAAFGSFRGHGANE